MRCIWLLGTLRATREEHVDHVRLADVEGEMNELTMDKASPQSTCTYIYIHTRI